MSKGKLKYNKLMELRKMKLTTFDGNDYIVYVQGPTARELAREYGCNEAPCRLRRLPPSEAVAHHNPIMAE